MFEINGDVEVELIEKKSKFITRLKKISSEEHARELLEDIRKAEKGASHNCYAYRILKENGQVYIKRSDDGEPGGTAGAPMLARLTGDNLVNVLAVTTRYFGGIKLGTGGLTSMYKKGVSAALEKSGIHERVEMAQVKIAARINNADFLLSLLEKGGFTVSKKSFTALIEVFLEIPLADLDKLQNIADRVHGELTALS